MGEEPCQGQPALKTDHRATRKAVAAAAIGNATEWYDSGVYSYLAVTIGSVFSPPAPGLQDHVGPAACLGAAALTWLVSVLAAEAIRRRGYRGPAENLLRRLLGPVRPRHRSRIGSPSPTG